jgi:uncharacterized cupin superfamily protein
VHEAELLQTPQGRVPEGEGWFVVNARETRWWHTDELGAACVFEGDVRFPAFGINVHVLQPGQPNCMYHGEDAQECFLVLFGECLLLVEGEERRLRAWDFVHCPAWTEHVFVGAGDGPCGILMVGERRAEVALRYPVAEVALRHGAGVEQETTVGREAYARFPEPDEVEYREGTLPG